MLDFFAFKWMEWFGVSASLADQLAVSVVLLLVVVGSLLLYLLIRIRLMKMIHTFVMRTSNRWDDALLEAGVVRRLLRMIPLGLMWVAFDRIFPDSLILAKRLLFATIILSAARAASAFLEAFSRIYHCYEAGKRKPIRPLFQTIAIVIYLVSGIFAMSVMLDKDPLGFFSLLGGLTAITMLVFKDTILGFVAGIQLSANDMVREGDWIEMPKYGADGDVVEVCVNTVKVRNWDRTISTIPTYSLISDSFKNWRGMSESGGRRIKRSLNIDMNTVRFVDEDMLERFRKMALLKGYVEVRQQEIEHFNAGQGMDLSASVVNGRRQTNLGLFRAYLQAYLRNHPKIHQEMTFLVRHLQPTEVGLPIEIYVFSVDKNWVNYEAIQADLFDHILAALPAFGLRVFQQPSGSDVAAALNR
jgi:miniconductance mechanosensitive channel